VVPFFFPDNVYLFPLQLENPRLISHFGITNLTNSQKIRSVVTFVNGIFFHYVTSLYEL